MKYHSLLSIRLLAITLITFCASYSIADVGSSTETSETPLHGFLKSMPEKSNSAVSPQGIKWLAAMMYVGASDQTASELKNAFSFDDDPSQVAERLKNESIIEDATTDVQNFRISNGIWADKQIALKPDFLSCLQNDFGANLETCDFENELKSAQTNINEWTRLQTGGDVASLFDNISSDSQLVLVNTICFRSEWLSPFDTKLTKTQKFTLFNGRKIDHRMMRKQLRCEYGEDAEAVCIELPYVQENLAMLFILPKNPRNWGNMERSMSGKKINEWCELMVREEVDCMIPKMNLTQSFDLRNVFKNIGVTTPFSTEKANFTKISDRDLHVSQAIQKIRIEVDETGTKATSAAGVEFAPKANLSGATPEKKRFYANRPFWFVIRNTETGTIYFLGRFVGLP